MFTWLKNFYDYCFNTGAKTIGLIELYTDIHIPIVSYVAPVEEGKLYRGSRIDNNIQALNVSSYSPKTIIDLRSEGPAKAERNYPINYVSIHIPIIDNTIPTDQEVSLFLAIVTNPFRQPIYVHCEEGVGRTGCMIAAYRVKVNKWSASKALDEAKKYNIRVPAQINWILNLKQ